MGPEYTELQAWSSARACTRCARRPAARTSSSAGRTARRRSSSAATSAPGAATSARSTPASPPPLDRDEPRRVAESVATMGLRYATITGVARDDLEDGGAWLYAETVRQIHAPVPGLRRRAADPRLQRRARAAGRGLRLAARGARAQRRDRAADLQADPARLPLRALAGRHPQARAAGLVTKSNLILGMGEEREEVSQALRDLHDAGCDLLTITQYLRPTPRHHPVDRWVKPEEFVELRDEAEEIGFAGVMSGPLVRSSYRAGRLYRQASGAQARRPPVLAPCDPRPSGHRSPRRRSSRMGLQGTPADGFPERGGREDGGDEGRLRCCQAEAGIGGGGARVRFARRCRRVSVPWGPSSPAITWYARSRWLPSPWPPGPARDCPASPISSRGTRLPAVVAGVVVVGGRAERGAYRRDYEGRPGVIGLPRWPPPSAAAHQAKGPVRRAGGERPVTGRLMQGRTRVPLTLRNPYPAVHGEAEERGPRGCARGYPAGERRGRPGDKAARGAADPIASGVSGVGRARVVVLRTGLAGFRSRSTCWAAS